jgi:hypothetical protein
MVLPQNLRGSSAAVPELRPRTASVFAGVKWSVVFGLSFSVYTEYVPLSPVQAATEPTPRAFFHQRADNHDDQRLALKSVYNFVNRCAVTQKVLNANIITIVSGSWHCPQPAWISTSSIRAECKG